jgi:hypothetical protein
VVVGSTRAVGEALQADVVVAGEDLVAGLARAELAASPAIFSLSSSQATNWEAFVHVVTLLPGHFALPSKSPIV